MEDDYWEHSEDPDSLLRAALQPLTGLTSLLLDSESSHSPYEIEAPVIAVLPGLARLQRLCLLGGGSPLPAGPWSGSLRAIGASLEGLGCSTQLLAACNGLQEVAVLIGGDGDGPNLFWQWARQHASLLRVFVQLYAASSQAAELAALEQARPELQEVRDASPFEHRFVLQDPFWSECHFVCGWI